MKGLKNSQQESSIKKHSTLKKLILKERGEEKIGELLRKEEIPNQIVPELDEKIFNFIQKSFSKQEQELINFKRIQKKPEILRILRIKVLELQNSLLDR